MQSPPPTSTSSSRFKSIIVAGVLATMALAGVACCSAVGLKQQHPTNKAEAGRSAVVERIRSSSRRTLRRSSPVAAATPSSSASASAATSSSSAEGTTESRDLLAASNDPTSSAFPVDLTHAVCPGLKGLDKFKAKTPEECEAKCSEDADCDVWQWCPYRPETPNSLACNTYDDGWTPGNWTRCYVATADSPKDKQCKPDKYPRWIGAAKSTSRIPQRTKEVASKRGFSGFLGDPKVPCGDAEVLG